jgi:hypothetical protein
MSQRTFEPIDLVSLPSGLSARALVTLVTELDTAARPHAAALSALVTSALGDARSKAGVLEVEIGRVVPPELNLPARKADRAVDTAFSICFHVLQQKARLPDTFPQGKRARVLLGRLFPERLAILRHAYKIEWQETGEVLRAIDQEKLEPDLAALVGAEVVANMRETHGAYGVALGITVVHTPFEPAVRERMDAVAHALRVYVVRVSASVDASDPASAARAADLLRPLAEWESRREEPNGSAGSAPPAGGTGPG